MKKIMENDVRRVDEHLTAIQKNVAAGEVAHCTKAERENILQRTPDDVRTRENAAARCTKVIKRRVLKETSKESQSGALGEVQLAPGNEKAPRKPLSEFFIDGQFSENREWKKELQRHCEEENTDQEETKVPEKKIEYLEQGDQQFTVEGRGAEITVDLVLQARAKMSDYKVSGPEDTVVRDCVFGEDLHNYEMFPGPLDWSDGCSQLMEDCDTGFPAENRTQNQRR